MREDLVLHTLVMLLDTSPHSPHLANLEKYDYVLHLKNFFVKRVFIVNLKQKFCIDRKLFELIIFLVSCQMFLGGDVKYFDETTKKKSWLLAGD